MPSGLASTVTVRWRSKRSIWLGPRASVELGQAGQLAPGPTVRRRDASARTSVCGLPRYGLLGPQPDVVLLVAFLVTCETGSPPTSTLSVSAIVCTGMPRSLARSRSIGDLHLGLAQRQRRVDVDEARRSCCSRSIDAVGVLRQLVQVGPGRLIWKIGCRWPAAWNGDTSLHGRRAGRDSRSGSSRASLHDVELRVVALVEVLHAHVDRAAGHVALPLAVAARCSRRSTVKRCDDAGQLRQPRFDLASTTWSARSSV